MEEITKDVLANFAIESISESLASRTTLYAQNLISERRLFQKAVTDREIKKYELVLLKLVLEKALEYTNDTIEDYTKRE